MLIQKNDEVICTQPAQCQHIGDYYHHRWSACHTLGDNILRWGYWQWAEGRAVVTKAGKPANNLFWQQPIIPNNPAPELPDGLWRVGNKIMFECISCHKHAEWPAEIEDFDIDSNMNLCGGSPRCCP